MFPQIFNATYIQKEMERVREKEEDEKEAKRFEKIKQKTKKLKEMMYRGVFERHYFIQNLNEFQEPNMVENSVELLQKYIDHEKINESNLLLIKVYIGKTIR